MFTRWVIVIFLGCIAASPAFAASGKANAISASVPAPDDRARQWLTLVDDANYEQSYTESGSVLKNGRDAATWAKTASDMRAPLGAMASRDLKSINLSRGNIAVVRYDSVFARKAAAQESVTLSFEKGGWSVTGYSVQ